MDLPTYTSIWRIEKRLYKLYDFRLPMPLPIGQLSVFAAIAVPYVVLLTVLGLPFNHTLIWLYLLPPGVLTWLATRPVLESKRLPELVGSQLRYLAEPRVWCRMAPLAESDVVLVTGRVWRRSAVARRPVAAPATASASASAAQVAAPAARAAAPAAAQAAGSATRPAARRPGWLAGQGQQRAGGRPVASRPGRATSWPSGPPAQRIAGPAPSRIASPPVSRPAGPPARLAGPPAPPGWPGRPATSAGPAGPTARPAAGRPVPARSGPVPPAAGRPGGPVPAEADAAWPDPARQAPAGPPGLGSARQAPAAGLAPPPAVREPGSDVEGPVSVPHASAGPQSDAHAGPRPQAGTGPQRPVVTVVSGGPGRTAPPALESALAGPSALRGDARQGRVLVVPGGHRPGRPDQLQRDRSRAQLPIAGPGKIVVLGCTVGAGQTMTTLLTGEVLASLRDDLVAVLDLNPGENSLTERATARPALNQAASLGPSRLEVLGQDGLPGSGPDFIGGDRALTHEPGGDARAFEFASTRYPLVLADPSTSAMPRLLAVADQLVLVAPASAAAASAITMTFEWLEAHGQASLCGAAIMVMNGVSRRTMTHVEQAERVAVGRCRAIVRVPWDDQLQNAAARREDPDQAAGPRLAAAHSVGPHLTGQQLPGQRTGGQHRASQPGAAQWAGLLSPATAGAYTALAGVLVAALAVPSAGHGQQGQPGPHGQASR